MGMLKYALAGAIKGGADTFLDLKKEERADKSELEKEQRADKREIAKEARGGKIWDTRQTRLAEIRATETQANRDWQEEQDYTKQIIQSEQAALDRDFKAEEGMLSRTATANKPMTVSSGQDVINPNGSLIYQNDDKLGSGKGKAGVKGGFSYKEATKYFNKLARSSFGETSFQALNDEQAIMATRGASISVRLWEKYNKEVDPNTIWSLVHKQIKENPSITEEAIQDIVDSAKNTGFWANEDDQKNIDIANGEAEKLRKSRWDISLPGENQAESQQAAGNKAIKRMPTQKEASNPDAFKTYLAKNTSLSFGEIEQVMRAKFGDKGTGSTLPDNATPAPTKPSSLMGLAPTTNRGEPASTNSAQPTQKSIIRNTIGGKDINGWYAVLKQAKNGGGRTSAALIKQARRNIESLGGQ